jgi:aldehyde dehydrogenase
MCTVLNKGEVCLSGSRLFVHEKVRDAFLEKYTRILAGIRMGDPTSTETQLGPQASQMQFDKIRDYLDLGPREGAKVLAGGKAAQPKGLEKGFFIAPTVFVDVKNTMRIAQEEIFGPVTSVITWKDEEGHPAVKRLGLWARRRPMDTRSGPCTSDGTGPGDRNDLDQPVL